MQAQDWRAARLALRARAPGLEAAAVDRALEERELVVAWLQRGTLQLVRAEDHGWLLALTGPAGVTAGRRRLRELGVRERAAERARQVAERALADDGPLDRAALAARMGTAGQATVHVLRLAALRGTIVLGPLRRGRPAYVLTRDWLGAGGAPVARERALAELARRYLAGHGPASAADLARWAGLPLRDARAGLGAIAAELGAPDGDLVDLAAREAAPRTVPPRLLGPFDPYLLGWADRGFAVAPAHARRVHPGGGILRAVATVGGRVVGTWSGARPALGAVEPLAPRTRAALEADAADVARFLS